MKYQNFECIAQVFASATGLIVFTHITIKYYKNTAKNPLKLNKKRRFAATICIQSELFYVYNHIFNIIELFCNIVAWTKLIFIKIYKYAILLLFNYLFLDL